MTDAPETQEAAERWRQGKINVFDEMARMERERNNWKAESLEQAKLLAMSADREEKLRTDLMLARKLAYSAMLEADRLRAQLHKERP